MASSWKPEDEFLIHGEFLFSLPRELNQTSAEKQGSGWGHGASHGWQDAWVRVWRPGGGGFEISKCAAR